MIVNKVHLRKLIGTLPDREGDPVNYALPLGETQVALNPLLGHKLGLRFTGTIRCKHCSRPIRKTYNQGYCFPCYRSLAECDSCIVRPELCHHFTKNTCRDPAWAMNHCMQSHIIYLANTSGLKVGITRASQVPTRWIDQGAVQALPILQVANRYQSGLIEVMLSHYVSDKTNWRMIVQRTPPPVDLLKTRDFLLGHREAKEFLTDFNQRFKGDLIFLSEAHEQHLHYPVLSYPVSVTKALNLDRTPLIEGQLLGIKGQYLLLDTGVFNVRKFTSYEVEFSTD